MHWRERRLSQEKVDLLKRTVAKGTDNDQFELFLSVCQRHGLDPFVKQVYCVLWPVSKHHQDEKGIWVDGLDMVIITGIGGYRKMAARDHKDYAGSSSAVFTWFDPPRKTPANRDIPQSATVKIHRRGAADTEATVYWEEFAPTNLNEKRADFWNRMPKNQLEKCAEAKGLRKAFPGLGDVFTEEEMTQRLLDITAGGREIVDQEGFAPSGRPVTFGAERTGSREAAQKVLEDKLAGKMALNPPIDVPSQPAAQQTTSPAVPQNLGAATPAKERSPVAGEGVSPSTAPRTSAKLPESAYHPENVPKSVTPPPFPKPKGAVEVDLTDPKSPILRGDLAGLLPILQEKFVMEWGADHWWHVLPGDVDAMRAFVAGMGYTFTQSSGSGTAMGPEHPPAGKGGSTSPSGASPAGGNEPTLVTGIIEQLTEKMTKGSPPTEKNPKGRASVPFLSILFQTSDRKKTFYSVFDHDMFPYLERAKAKAELCRLFVKKSGEYANVVGLKSIGTQEFEDGKVPVIQQKDREAGGRTLFNA